MIKDYYTINNTIHNETINSLYKKFAIYTAACVASVFNKVSVIPEALNPLVIIDLLLLI